MLGIFKIALRLREQHAFLWQSLKIFERFQYFNFETNFLKTETFFKKLEYCFLAEITKTENYTKLPCQKLILIEWGLQNGPITKKGVLPVTHFSVWKTLFQLKNLIWCTSYPNVHIFTFRRRWSFIWGCFFMWVSLTQRALHVESTSIRRGYYVDTSKTKFRRICTLFPRSFSM